MKIFEYNLDEISTPTGTIYIRFRERMGDVPISAKGAEKEPYIYLTAYAGFANSPMELKQADALRNFNNLKSGEDIVNMIKSIFNDKLFLSAKTVTVYDELTDAQANRHPFLNQFFNWVSRNGGERINIIYKEPGEGGPNLKRPRKKNPNKGRKIRDIPQGETKKTVTFTVGSRFYREIQNNLPNIMKYRGPNNTFVMPNDIFMAFKKQAEAKFPFADIKVQNRVATGESIPGTFVQPSAGARQQAQAVMQKDADDAVVGRAKMGITDVDEGSDKSAHDCGIVDGYYGRQPNPHKIEMGQRIKLTDPKEINDYMMGYKDDSVGSKNYEEDFDNGITASSQPDHEASMAKGELYNTVKNAKELFHMIKDGENLEGWVASKITKAADYINTVHDYMMYEKQYNESLNERSTSEKQARTMAAAAHNPKFAKKVGIKTSVAKEFNKADKGTKRLSNAMKKEDVTDEGGPASRSLCRSKKPDSALGASNLASCVSQGLRAHKSGRADYVNGKQLRVGGKKVKGKAHGGPLPDYS
jgi:hypothetical protein